MYPNTVTLTIGRNWGKAGGPTAAGKPMSDLQWATVERAALAILAETIGTADAWTEVHYGIGIWEGVAEESMKVMLSGADITPDMVAALRTEVLDLAEAYWQDAIAINYGWTELINA